MRNAVKDKERNGWIDQKAQAPARANIIPMNATKKPSVFVKRRGPIFLPFLRLMLNFICYTLSIIIFIIL